MGIAKMIRLRSRSIVNIVLVVAGAVLLVDASIALERHEPSLHFWGTTPKGQAWEIMFMGAFCFLVGFMGFVNRKKGRGKRRPGQPPWFDHLV
jgi:hypothetical protein